MPPNSRQPKPMATACTTKAARSKESPAVAARTHRGFAKKAMKPAAAPAYRSAAIRRMRRLVMGWRLSP